LKRAVLVGIDHYDFLGPLTGCIADVNKLEARLKENFDESSNFTCVTWTSDKETVSRAELLHAIDMTLGPGVQSALFFFAGHGVSARNDLVLAAQDGTAHDAGVTMSEFLSAVQGSKVAEILIILDCCFSGKAGAVASFGAETAALRSGVSILAASRDDQTAAEVGQGMFTMYLCDALDGGAADVQGVVTLASAYAYLSESFGALEQRPMFKTNVDSLHPLRRCQPAVSRKDLQKLPKIFPTADFELPLDPTYEPLAKVKKKNPENEAVFALLQRCRAARLVEPVDVPHLWNAAMESKPARLTTFGRHYWRLAKHNKLQP
jgi:Caspase domain